MTPSRSTVAITTGIYLVLFGVMALVLFETPTWAGIAISLTGSVLAIYWIVFDYRASRKYVDERRRADGFSDGDSVEVDCRLCGQFNRVLAARLRDRPICGRCKTRLMPGKRVVLCRTSPIEGFLSVELKALWSDEDRLWGCLADHLTMKRRVNDDQRRSAAN